MQLPGSFARIDAVSDSGIATIRRLTCGKLFRSVDQMFTLDWLKREIGQDLINQLSSA